MMVKFIHVITLIHIVNYIDVVKFIHVVSLSSIHLLISIHDIVMDNLETSKGTNENFSYAIRTKLMCKFKFMK
jgi:hypothetical protein